MEDQLAAGPEEMEMEMESSRIELSEFGSNLRSLSRSSVTSPSQSSSAGSSFDCNNEELPLQWAALGRLPTFQRLKSSLLDEYHDHEDHDQAAAGIKRKRVVDVTKLGGPERRIFIEKLIKNIESDNLRLLKRLRKRIDKVDVKLPTVEVRFRNLCVEMEYEVVRGKPLPTLWNSLIGSISHIFRVSGLKSECAKINIINEVSGIIKPGRMTLLLGPPGSGKTSLLKALSGNLDRSLKVTGEISYNGYKLAEFIPQKTSAYISQYDLHFPEMTVRETLNFSACCQGIGSRPETMIEVCKREKEVGVFPDPDVDTYMKAISVEGQEPTLQTDYILKILGLDICADTLVGDGMRIGISGGQKKRLTTGDMIVGPTKALFMDEISNGLDSSTTHQIISYLQQLAHITDATVLVSLLQPAPEAFELFDDIMLMAEGKIVYHGPRTHVLEFFEGCGFRCPERKGVADFLQEVLSRKDQPQYWHSTGHVYKYISVDALSKTFKESHLGTKLNEDLSKIFPKTQSDKKAISFSKYSLSKWSLFRACVSREFLLLRRNSFIYIFKLVQLVIMGSITMTVFLKSRMDVDLLHANYYMGALYYALVMLLGDGFPELVMTVARLPVFYKQRDLYFYPAWAYSIPAAVVKVPLSLFAAIVWTCLTYYVIGYSPEVDRFFGQMFLLFALHLASISVFRFLASICRNLILALTVGIFALLFMIMFGGFVIPHSSMPSWLKWAFWISPLSYGEIGIVVNEFLAQRWNTMLPTNITTGKQTLQSRGLDFDGYYYWISVGALFGFIIIFNVGFTLALSYLNPPSSRAIISKEKLTQLQRSGSKKITHVELNSPSSLTEPHQGRMVLPFEPLTLVFQDVQYFVDIPLDLRGHGTEKRLQLLSDVTGVFMPGILTALMGVSGAGKTTLLDVLAGRKTTGIVEGEIKIGGYPKVQDTFARISGYCEQTDVHSPQITVEESVTFSAWLRLHPAIDSKTKSEFVKEVLQTIELGELKDALVGMPGVSGLSTEQRKRLTIAVELVANPFIILMDEPTTGLDARSAAIVMRAVKNVVRTGRTVVCTVHQPSIDIFEAFDQLVLLKKGGRMIYCGPLGRQSSRVIDYFEGIEGVPKIRNNYNPATWMLEVTSTSAEAELGLDFAQIYTNSTLCRENKDLVKIMSTPPSGSTQLRFPTQFPQNGWGQFKSCLWKQNLSYWRSPSYNLVRFLYMLFAALLVGVLFWDQGRKIDDQQSMFNVLASTYIIVIFCGMNNCSLAIPNVATERTVYYRERFAGMYTSWVYSIAQVTIEVPYLLAQTLTFVIITYPMVGYTWSAYKLFWYFFAMLCSMMYYTYLGMLLASLTPSYPVATVLASAFYMLFNLFSGFLIPRPQIPKWWLWLYYITPTSWTLNGMLTSQYGDVHKEIMVFGERKTVAEFLNDYFDFHRDQLPIVAVVLIIYPILLAFLFAYFIGKLNFQRR